MIALLPLALDVNLVRALHNTYAQTVIAMGPVGYWRLGELSGTNAADVMGANPGTYVNTPTLGATSLLTGDSDTAVTFARASSQAVTAGLATNVVDNWTIALWVKPSASATTRNVFYNGATGSINGYGLYLTAANRLWGFAESGGGGGNLTDPALSSVLTAGVAYFAVLVRRSGTTYLYLNGALDLTGTTNAPVTPTGLTSIGAEGGNALFMDGSIDEPAIWNRALSAAEIAALYAMGHAAAAQYPYGLTIGTTGDVIGKVDGPSLHISEAGPGGISSSSFTIVDATSSVTIADDADVRMWDYVRDLPMILGFVESISITPWAAVGRAIDIGVYGIEALLDSTVVPKLTVTPDDLALAGVAAIFDIPFLQLVGGLTGLRAGSTYLGTGSTLTRPVGTSGNGDLVFQTVVFDGMSVRSAFEGFLANSTARVVRGPVFLGTDLWGGIRYFGFGGGIEPWSTGVIPSDYAILTIDNTSSSGPHATSMSWKRDLSSGAITNAVYVEGAAPAATGWVVGDTTSGRHEASTVTSGLTEASKQGAATAVMGQRSTPAGRGSLTLENYTPTNVHPGSMLIFTDTQMGWSAHQFLITQIDKSITNVRTGTQTWTVSFFDPGETPTAGPASAMRLMGTRTRATPV